MAIKFQGELLTGIISNDGPSSSGKTHAVIYGEMQCKSGMNFGSRNLHVKAFDTKTLTLAFLIRQTQCSKCQAELTKKQEAQKAEKAGA